VRARLNSAEGANTASSAAIKQISLDLETFSQVDLARSGTYRYVESPDFEILLFGYSIDGGPVQVADFTAGEQLPPEILAALTDDTVIKWAFNAQFERICLSKWLGLPPGQYLDPKSWRCTMVWSAYMGLPLSLEGSGAILGLEKQKLTEGKDLVRYFCQPCRPTAANGGRIRNMPEHAPEKWEQFKAYNQRDVEAEMAIQAKLAKFPVPEEVWGEYLLDQKINDLGVVLDMDLVRQSIRIDEHSRSELIRLLQELTELENPNSVIQMKQWLSDHGLETDTLGKKAVDALLNGAPPELKEVLRLRQQLAKSSVRKYTAMENAVCADGRIRGMFFFYGANRTGRFSSKYVQLQNLPQNHLADLEQARGLVRNGDLDAVKILYEDVPDTLSQLIRTAFVPKAGCKFIVADFASIERVVLAWLAGEKWVLEAYGARKDLYIATASKMFRVPAEQINKKSPLRQKGKVADLACIAEGQLVLTEKGLVPIEDVTVSHRVWDGESWVAHDGVVFRGKGEVVEYEGLRATADHLVWIEGQSWPVRFGAAASSGAHLIQTGDGRRAIRLGENYQSGEKMEQEVEPLLCANAVYRLWKHPVAGLIQPEKRQIKRVPELLSAEADTSLARQATHSCKAALREPKRWGLSQLWSKGDKICLLECDRGWGVPDKNQWSSKPGNGNRSNQQRHGLRTWKPSVCNACREQQEQEVYGFKPFFPRVLALCKKCGNKKVVPGPSQRRNYPGCREGRVRKAEELESNQCQARLYDIRNAGQHHRFTVSGKLVHNCGYGGSVGALTAMGALDMGLTEDELKPLVDAWRKANPNIVKLWWDVDRAALEAVKERSTTETHGICFSYKSGMFFITLPSGRRLAYVKPRIGENRFGSKCITYEGVGGAKKWERIESYGPKFVENIVQAISRDLLSYAMRRLDAMGYNIVMHVHDEVVIEAPVDVSVDDICAVMSQPPPWAKGLLLRADGYECGFYKKD
jgi:DNA polymerase